MFLLFRIHFFIFVHLFSGLPSIGVQSDIEHIQYSNHCTEYDVLKESLINSTMNVDRCGEPLRITAQLCYRSDSLRGFLAYLYRSVKCFHVEYIYHEGCRDYVLYVPDTMQVSRVGKKIGSNALRIKREQSCFQH
ncbi:hypothetical protein ACOME3_008391 [Neoechinorhynchus agilis]